LESGVDGGFVVQRQFHRRLVAVQVALPVALDVLLVFAAGNRRDGTTAAAVGESSPATGTAEDATDGVDDGAAEAAGGGRVGGLVGHGQPPRPGDRRRRRTEFILPLHGRRRAVPRGGSRPKDDDI